MLKFKAIWPNKVFGLDLSFKLSNLEIQLMFTINNLYGKKYIPNKMESLKLLNQENIGLNSTIWGNQSKYKLMIDFQLILKINKCFPSPKIVIKNGLLY